eukprot:4651841-Lingulodinium_polyedra.AAC.1
MQLQTRTDDTVMQRLTPDSKNARIRCYVHAAQCYFTHCAQPRAQHLATHVELAPAHIGCTFGTRPEFAH